jgi:MFS family permease
MHGSHDPYAALRFRDYRHLLAAGVLGSIGGQIQSTAVAWEIWERTHAFAALAWVGLAGFFPVLLLSLPAGHASDRHNRRLLYQLALGVLTLSSLGLAAISYLDGPVALVYVCLALTGSSRALSSPARMSLLPQIIPEHLLSNAVTWNSSGWQIAQVMGPALGGLVIFCTDRNFDAYVISAGCSIAAALLVMPIRPVAEARKRAAPSFESLVAGVRFVRHSRLLLAAITLDLFAVLLGGATVLLSVYAQEILVIGAMGYGWLRASPAIGAFVMALWLAHRRPLAQPGRALLLAVTGFGVATVVFGFSREPVLSFLMLALIGALDNISVVVRHTLIQMLTPDAMRGRVSAVNMVFISSSNELGEFESGITAYWFGPVVSVVGGGIGTVLVVLAVMLRWPELARLGPLHRVVAEGISPDGAPLSKVEASQDGLPAEKAT